MVSRPSTAAPPAQSRVALALRSIEQNATWLAILLVVLATARIALTYGPISRTGDESAHLAAGLEYWDRGTYLYEVQHPPLTRLAVSLLPYLDGSRSTLLPYMYQEGAFILHHSPAGYSETLTLARMGVLPFFWLACCVVYNWALRYFDRKSAALALALFTFLPAVLAHAGVATTDMGLTALCAAALLATLSLIERPSTRTGILWGVSLGLAITAKFSILAFYPASLLGALAAALIGKQLDFNQVFSRVRMLSKPVAIGSAVTFLTVWAVYRFSFGPSRALGGISVPFPDVFEGIADVIVHNSRGHLAYLLGQTSQHGFWYYYPVALAVKLPLAFILLTGAGIWLGWKHRHPAILPLIGASLGILVVGAVGNINIGIRHILPILILFSLIAAYATLRGLSSTAAYVRNGTVALLAWMALSSAFSHPDYLAYFNELALGQPERILADSDLDWGQDIQRAQARLRQLNARNVAFRPFNMSFEDLQGFPPAIDIDPRRPMTGWNLVSITAWKVSRYGQPAGQPLWIDTLTPTERIGRGMFLYYVPDQTQ